MTQFAKEEIRQQILAAAREEFLRCGFEKASIRTIAADAKTAKSNLYNYFVDKDALFCAVLEPTVAGIRHGLEIALGRNEGADAGTYTVGSQEAYIHIVMEFVGSHSADVFLLLFRSGGSSLEGFRGEVTEKFTDVLAGWFAQTIPGRAPSRLFVGCVADFYVSVVERLMLEKPTREQAMEYMGEFLKFVYGGWTAVMNS
jgi:TetR/AcrR family transcriptional regulator, cholesterol catabolism regulator